jgi:N6-adenosine-specific RNA methylase IME4
MKHLILPSRPVALKSLEKLGREIEKAPTFEALNKIARTAKAAQREFRDVKDVSDTAGEVWISAELRLASMLVKIPKAKRGRAGPGRGKKEGSKSGPAFSYGGPTLEEIGVGKKRSSAARQLGAMEAQERAKAIAELKEEGKGVSPSAVLKKNKEAKREQKRQSYTERQSTGGTVNDLSQLAESGSRFSVIYADPPWTFEVYSGNGKERSAERHYDTMTLDAIAALPIEALAADDCALFLWSVWPELPGALRIMESWGFTYKTCGFLWAKQNRSGEGFFTGMGYWTRANTEPCLLATRGSPTRLAMDVPQLLVAPVGEHSAKPSEARRRIQRLVPGPYLELFAREKIDGWITWGNELERAA